MPASKKRVRLGRRDFLRWSARAGGGLLMMPVLQACQRLGLIEATKTSTDLPMPTYKAPGTVTPVMTISPQSSPTVAAGVAQIAFIRTRDRSQGIRRALSLLGQNPVANKSVLIKPNFNSPDPAPASTHPDTLRVLIESLQEMGASGITVADRSGMGDTRGVMQRLGVYALA